MASMTSSVSNYLLVMYANFELEIEFSLFSRLSFLIGNVYLHRISHTDSSAPFTRSDNSPTPTQTNKRNVMGLGAEIMDAIFPTK